LRKEDLQLLILWLITDLPEEEINTLLQYWLRNKILPKAKTLEKILPLEFHNQIPAISTAFEYIIEFFKLLYPKGQGVNQKEIIIEITLPKVDVTWNCGACKFHLDIPLQVFAGYERNLAICGCPNCKTKYNPKTILGEGVLDD
jgi:hypothetical protein